MHLILGFVVTAHAKQFCSQIQLDKTKSAASLSLCLPLVCLYLLHDLHGKLVCCKESPGSVKVAYSLFLKNLNTITGIFNVPISIDYIFFYFLTYM